MAGLKKIITMMVAKYMTANNSMESYVMAASLRNTPHVDISESDTGSCIFNQEVIFTFGAP